MAEVTNNFFTLLWVCHVNLQESSHIAIYVLKEWGEDLEGISCHMRQNNGSCFRVEADC